LHHNINPLNAELNPICHLLALLGVHHILHVSSIRVKLLLHKVYIQLKALVISRDLPRECRLQTVQPLKYNVLCYLVTPQNLAGQKFLKVEKQLINTSCKVTNPGTARLHYLARSYIF